MKAYYRLLTKAFILLKLNCN